MYWVALVFVSVLIAAAVFWAIAVVVLLNSIETTLSEIQDKLDAPSEDSAAGRK